MGQLEEDNKELARRMLEALSENDVDWVRDNYAEEIKIWVTGTLPFSGTNDKAGALLGMPEVLGLFPGGLSFAIKALTAEGERVAIEATSEGTTFRGDKYQQEYHFLMCVRDGKIIESTIDVGVQGVYAATWPFDCAKSKAITDKAVAYLLAHLERFLERHGRRLFVGAGMELVELHPRSGREREAE